MILRSIITCPNCGTAIAETMLIDACQFFYACNAPARRSRRISLATEGRFTQTCSTLLVSMSAERSTGLQGRMDHVPRPFGVSVLW
jgi:hypothetical protein